MTDFVSVWDEAGYSVEAEAAQRALARAKTASASIWPFLALAQDAAEFGQRLDLAGDTLTKAASDHQVDVVDLVAAYTREYGLLVEAHKTAADSTHSECPNHPGQSFNKSTGDCSCGSNHHRWANSNNPGGQKSSSKTAADGGRCSKDVDGDRCVRPNGHEGACLSDKQVSVKSKTSGKLPDALKEHQFKAADETKDDGDGDEDDAAKEASRRVAVQDNGSGAYSTGGTSEYQSGGLTGDKNVWGTNKADVGEGFCPDCEKPDGTGHYTNCPRYNGGYKQSSRRTAGVTYRGTTYGTGTVGKDGAACDRCGRGVKNSEAYVSPWSADSAQQVLCRPCGDDVERGYNTDGSKAGSRRTAGHAAGGGGDVTRDGYHYPEEGAEGNDDDDTGETDERTEWEKYRDKGHNYDEGTPGDTNTKYRVGGDINTRYYDKLARLVIALEEGVDPLAWVGAEDGGQGQPEKPVEAGIEAAGTEVPADSQPPALGSRHPFALGL
jgi:hypothetical protein